MNTSALIIDDEIQIRRLLRVALESAGYTVHEAADGQSGLAEVAFRRPDVILLDLGLPDLDGVEVLKRLREWSETPVLILSVRDREEDKVSALDAGADDYVTKPFSTPELLARLRVAQRRAKPLDEEAIFTTGKLQVDLVARIVTLGGREVKLHGHRICAAAFVRAPRWPCHDAPANPARNLGAEIRGAPSILASLCHPPAAEDRARPDEAGVDQDRAGDRLSLCADGRLACGS